MKEDEDKVEIKQGGSEEEEKEPKEGQGEGEENIAFLCLTSERRKSLFIYPLSSKQSYLSLSAGSSRSNNTELQVSLTARALI